MHADGPVDAQITISSTGLRIDDRLRLALPAPLRSALGDWRIEGLTDTHTQLCIGPACEEGDHATTTVTLRNGRILHPKLRTPLDAVTGDVTIDDRGVTFRKLHGRFGSAAVQLDGLLGRPDGPHAAELALTAFGLTLDENVLGLLPPGLAPIWDKLNPAGQVNVHLDRIVFHQDGQGEAPPIAVKGYVEFRGVTFRGSTTPIRLAGTLSGGGTICVGPRGTSLDGRAVLSSLTWGAHRFTDLAADWSFARTEEGKGILTLPDVKGHVYGGIVSGKVDLRFTDKAAAYDVSAMLQGMQLWPFVRAERAAAGQVGEGSPVNGTANAGLYLSGRMGDITSRRGGGRVEIVDGQLYRLPILLAILNVLNLSSPQDAVLDEARAEFFLVADRIQFQEIALRGDTLALTGSGTMTLADRAVDWHLVNVGANAWARIPVLAEFVEGASRELVELHVTGPISQPRVQARSFGALRDEFKRLFQKRRPRTVAPSSAS